MQLRADQVQSVCVYAPAARIALMLPGLNASLPAAPIDTPARAAMYLAQLAHETGQFRYLEELWGPTLQQLRYEPPGELAAKLGNVQPGDGKLFKGRGCIQLTGRANYARCGEELDLDLVGHPQLASQPQHAFAVSAWFWRTRGLNAFADAGDVIGATRRINGGTNGLAERLEYFRRAREALGL